MRRAFSTTSYRYPTEIMILTVTLITVFAVIALTATATVCVSLVFVIGMVAYSYFVTQQNHRELLSHALRVTPQSAPELFQIANEAASVIQVEPVDIFVIPSRELNAYTFGLSSPKAIVVYSALLKVMDRDEIMFVLGHEMGHVKLGHTWLNSLIGGMAGIPAPVEAALVLTMAFRWWNRACEYSSDRAGMLACGSPEKGISSLVKLHAAAANRPVSLEEAMHNLETEDDTLLGNVSELLMSHPLAVKRINEIRQYAATAEYQRLRQSMAANILR